MLSTKTCPICAWGFTCALQKIYLQRQQTQAMQYFCMHCQSFFHRSGFQEDDSALKNDVTWLAAHPGDFSQLIAELRGLFPEACSCFEAGCGVGHLLSQLKAAGYHPRGVDVNAQAIRVARDKYGVDAEAGYFKEGMVKADLLFAIDVLEHLEEPRTFFAAMLASLTPGGGIIVRIPYVECNRWHYLHGANGPKEHEPTDPFYDNSVHITHFSARGLQLMAESLGAKLVERLGQHKDFFVFTRAGTEAAGTTAAGGGRNADADLEAHQQTIDKLMEHVQELHGVIYGQQARIDQDRETLAEQQAFIDRVRRSFPYRLLRLTRRITGTGPARKKSA